MESENPEQNREGTKNSQINNLNEGMIIEPEQNTNQGQSEEQIQSKEIENNQIMDNNSDFVSNKNYNEDIEGVIEDEENKENIEQNMEKENYEENNNDRVIELNSNNLENDKYELQGEYNNDFNNNNLSENMQNNQQLFNNENLDESVQNYIVELQNKLNLVMNENDKLRMINQKISMGFNDLKNRNLSLNQKLKNILLQNQKLRQMKNNNIELINSQNQIQYLQNIIHQLSNDKKILESKLKNKQILSSNQNQNLNILNNKNNQLIKSPKAKISFTPTNNSQNENNQIYKNKIIILEKNNKKLSQNNNELENQNKYLQKENQKMFVDLKNKDNYIVNLNNKISLFKKEYNRQIDTFHKDNDQTQFLLNQLLFEREQLMKENSELKNGINQLNYKLKEISMFTKMQKSDFNNKMNKMYEDKLDEYKRKIIVLKNRIKELLGIETHSNYIISRGNSARIGHNNIQSNVIKKNRSFKYNKNLNILTDFNLYSGKNNTMKDYKKFYSNFDFGTK